MTLFLESDEIEQLTAKKRRSSQVSALNQMGIQHLVRPDGTVAVLRAHVETLFGHGQHANRRKTAPDFSCLQ